MARGPLAPAFAALALAVLLLPVSVATPQDWTRPRLDDANSASDGAPPGGGGQLAWNRTVGVNVTSAPIAAMGKVIVGTAEGAVYALDVATGSILWSRTTATPITGTAAAFDGIAYVGTERGLVALSLDDGREVWSRHEDQPVVGAPLVANGIVYFGTTGGRFLALDVSNSDPVWGPVATDGPIHSGPVLAAGRVFVHTQAGTLWGFDALRGTVHVRADVSPGRATPAFSEGVLWLTAASGVRAIDPATGQVVREWGLPTQDRALTSPVVRDRRLWMGTDAGVAHFDLCDAREPAWTRSLPDVAADLALAGRFLYVMDAEGSVHAIEADTGRTAWTYAAGAPSSPQRPLPPIVTDGLLIFTTGAGDVRALDLRDASRLSFPPQRSDACAETRCELPSQPGCCLLLRARPPLGGVEADTLLPGRAHVELNLTAGPRLNNTSALGCTGRAVSDIDPRGAIELRTMAHPQRIVRLNVAGVLDLRVGPTTELTTVELQVEMRTRPQNLTAPLPPPEGGRYVPLRTLDIQPGHQHQPRAAGRIQVAFPALNVGSGIEASELTVLAWDGDSWVDLGRAVRGGRAGISGATAAHDLVVQDYRRADGALQFTVDRPGQYMLAVPAEALEEEGFAGIAPGIWIAAASVAILLAAAGAALVLLLNKRT